MWRDTGLLTLLLSGLLAPALGAGQEPVNDRAKVLEEFTKRTKAYADLQRKLTSELPKLPDKTTPEQIQAHEKELTAKIRARRAARAA